MQLELRATYSDGAERVVTNEADWSSSDDTVATVVDGLVRGRSEGGFDIQAEFEDESGRWGEFRVVRGAADYAFAPLPPSRIEVGDTGHFRVNVTRNGSRERLTEGVSSSAPNVLELRLEGDRYRYTGRGVGTAEIRVSHEGERRLTHTVQVERGPQVTVSNVSADHVGFSYTEVTGTVRNTGGVAFSSEWSVWARFYDQGGGLLAENESYSWTTRRLPVGAQQVFEVSVEIRAPWGYYTLEFFDGANHRIPCSGCGRFR